MSDVRGQWEDQYRQGSTPWDTRITPPEVVQFWTEHTVPPGGVALDLGCGTATNVAYLAGCGLFTIGCEFSSLALVIGQTRLHQNHAALLPRIHLIQADVTQLPLRGIQACYILDIGCFHGLDAAVRPAYVQGVVDNLASGGYYHLFAFDLLPEAERPPDKLPRGVGEREVEELFAPQLQVVDILRGNPDRQPCRWYLLRKGLGGSVF